MDNPKKFLKKTLFVVIDRPLGSKHPKFNEMVYPINYGFIPDTLSGDGKEIDAYILGITTPVKSFVGECIAYIERKEEFDPKLIVVPQGLIFNEDEILKQVQFQEKYFTSKLILAQ